MSLAPRGFRYRGLRGVHFGDELLLYSNWNVGWLVRCCKVVRFNV